MPPEKSGHVWCLLYTSLHEPCVDNKALGLQSKFSLTVVALPSSLITSFFLKILYTLRRSLWFRVFIPAPLTLEASNSLLWIKAKALYDSQKHLPYLSCDNQKSLDIAESKENIRLCFPNFIPSLEYNYYSLERRPVMSGLSLHVTQLSISLPCWTRSYFLSQHTSNGITTHSSVPLLLLFTSVSHVRDYRKHYVWITSVSHYSGTVR